MYCEPVSSQLPMAYHHRHPRLSPICYCFAPPVQDRMTGRLPLMEKQTTAYHKPPCHCIQQSSLELMLTSQCGLYIRRLDYAWFPNNRKLSRDALKSCAAVFSSRCLYRASLAFADLVQFGLSVRRSYWIAKARCHAPVLEGFAPNLGIPLPAPGAPGHRFWKTGRHTEVEAGKDQRSVTNV